MKHVWVAELRSGKPNIARFSVEKETEKTYSLGKRETIIGYVSEHIRLSKSDMRVFESEKDAVNFMIASLKNYREELSERMTQTTDEISKLIDLVTDDK